MNMEIYNNIDQLCYARETRTPGKHISMHGMHAASRCIHAEIVHCWLYSYIQSFNHAYSYGTPIRVWDSTMSHTRMGRYTHMGQNRCTIPKTHLSVQRPKLRTLMQTAFSTPAVWICEAPWRTSVYGCHRLCTQTVRSHGTSYCRCAIPKMSMAVHHPTKWSLWHKRHFRKPAAQICIAHWRMLPYGWHWLCTQTGRSCGTSYNSCTISGMRIAVQHTKGSTLMQTAFSYTRCTALHCSLMYVAVRVPHTLYTNYEIPWCLVQ